ncbi:MAG: hypothetical protein Q9191_005720 [Dirinaria sp. TL-2023a]
MDGAASVIAVISLALSSSQAIYNTVSGLKNAPRAIQQMVSNLRDLSILLQQLLSRGDSLHLAADLAEIVKKCAENLNEFQGKLTKLSSPTDNGAERLWKNVKALLQEKNLDRMSALLQQHVTILSLQMQIIEERRLSLHSERVEVLFDKQHALSATNSNTLEKTRECVDKVHDIVTDFGQTTQESCQSAGQTLEGIEDKVRALTGMSTGQSTKLDAILEVLKQLLPRNAQHHASAATETIDDAEIEKKAHEVSEEHGLRDSLNRLSLLAQEKEKTMFSNEAESIICDIEQLLAISLKAEESTKAGSKRGRVFYDDDSNDDRHLQYQHEVKRMRGHLTASHCLVVNEKVTQPWNGMNGSPELKATTHRRSLRDGNFIVCTRRKIHKWNHSMEDSQSKESETLEASITFVPNSSQTAQIVVTFQQRLSYQGSFLRRPTLSVSALLPEDSNVFWLIKRGDLHGLMKALNLRKAYLSDRDVKGRCLLNDSLHLLFNHGREFVINDRDIEPSRFLDYHLDFKEWTTESVALILHMYPQDLDDCLHLALGGSRWESSEGLAKVLVLLIESGADVYARNSAGYSISDLACNVHTEWWGFPCDATKRFYLVGNRRNFHLQLREIWADALSACGYNAEEVISSSMRLKELSDTKDCIHDENESGGSLQARSGSLAVDVLNDTPRPDSATCDERDQVKCDIASRLPDYDSYSRYDWSMSAEDGPYFSAFEGLNDAGRPISPICDLTSETESNSASLLPSSSSYSHYDWSMLEEDNHVWKD